MHVQSREMTAVIADRLRRREPTTATDHLVCASLDFIRRHDSAMFATVKMVNLTIMRLMGWSGPNEFGDMDKVLLGSDGVVMKNAYLEEIEEKYGDAYCSFYLVSQFLKYVSRVMLISSDCLKYKKLSTSSRRVLPFQRNQEQNCKNWHVDSQEGSSVPCFKQSTQDITSETNRSRPFTARSSLSCFIPRILPRWKTCALMIYSIKGSSRFWSSLKKRLKVQPSTTCPNRAGLLRN